MVEDAARHDLRSEIAPLRALAELGIARSHRPALEPAGAPRVRAGKERDLYSPRLASWRKIRRVRRQLERCRECTPVAWAGAPQRAAARDACGRGRGTTNAAAASQRSTATRDRRAIVQRPR